MKCPHCSKDGKSLVLESRPHEGAVYRRRACKACGRTFVSVEGAPAGQVMPTAVSNSYKRRGAQRTQATGGPTDTIVSTGKELAAVWR